jgi:flagellar protein FliO/FliZ
MNKFLCYVFFGLSLLFTSAKAQTPIVIKTPNSLTDPSTVVYPRAEVSKSLPPSTSSINGTEVSFFVVILGGLLGFLFWKRIQQKSTLSVHSEKKLSVVETRSLGNRQYLIVANYGDQKFLLGVCPGKIDMLSVLNKPSESIDE